MIACGIFVLAGIISWQNVEVGQDRLTSGGDFAVVACFCWLVAIACAVFSLYNIVT